MSLKLYVGTWQKYNNGNLDGEWVDTEDFSYASDFWEHCSEIHKDEEDPEFDIQDFDYNEDWEECLWNYSGKDVDEYYELLDKMQSMNLDNDPELFTALCDRDFTEDYAVYRSMDDLCDEVMLSKCDYNKAIFDSIKYYIDFEQVKFDLNAGSNLEELSDGRVVEFF